MPVPDSVKNDYKVFLNLLSVETIFCGPEDYLYLTREALKARPFPKHINAYVPTGRVPKDLLLYVKHKLPEFVPRLTQQLALLEQHNTGKAQYREVVVKRQPTQAEWLRVPREYRYLFERSPSPIPFNPADDAFLAASLEWPEPERLRVGYTDPRVWASTKEYEAIAFDL